MLFKNVYATMLLISHTYDWGNNWPHYLSHFPPRTLDNDCSGPNSQDRTGAYTSHKTQCN